MANLVISTAVAAGTFYVTGGNVQATAFAFSATNAALAARDLSKKRIDGPRLTDLKFPGTEYGDPILWLIGNQRLPGQVWWASEKREVATTSSEGKGSGPKVTTFTYEVDVLIGINEEDGDLTRLVDVSRIWSNGKIVRNRLTGADEETLSNVFREDLWRRLTVYTGHEAQLPDPTYEAAVGVGNAPAYRGRGTIFIEGLQLDGSGQLPLLTFEALTSATVNIEDAVLTDVAIARNSSALPVGTIAINSDDVDSYIIAVGQWDTGYSSTLVNVYSIGLDTSFVNSRFGGSLVTPVTLIGTFNVTAARITPGHGTSDVPLFVQNELSTTQMFTYTVPDGTRTAYTVGEDYSLAAGGENVRFCQSGDRIIFGASQVASKKLHLFTVQVGGTVTTPVSSAILGDYVNSIATIGDFVYAATKSTKEVYKLDTATMTVQATIQRPSYAVGAAADTNALLVVINGQLALIGNDDGGTAFYMWTLDGVTWTELAGAIPAGYIQANEQGHQSIGVVGSLLVSGLNVAPVATELYQTWTAPITLTPSPVTLQETVEALCARAGLASTQYDASGLATITTPVRSAAMTQVEGVRGLLEQLRSAYGFECVLSDKLYFRPRGAATVRTIAYEDLGAGEESAAEEPLPLTIAADLELPPQVSVQFFNASNDYQTGTEFSDRLVLTSQVATQQVQFGLAMTPAEAKAVADRLNSEAAMGLTTTQIALTLEHADLEPGDSIAATTSDGEAMRFRLGRKSDAGGVLTFEAVRDDAGSQTTNGATDSDYTEGTTVSSASRTLWQLLDIPMLRDADDVPGWYAAEKGLTTTWPGGQVQVSANNTDFEVAATVNESAVFGVCTTTLADFAGGSATFDETNTLTVDVGFGELASSTRETVLNDNTTNSLRVGSEIIRFVTATQTGSTPNTYTLSRLLRGQLGTEWAMDGHEADEECCLLRMQGLRSIATQAADIDQLRYVKGVTLGTSAANITADEFTDTGVRLKPYAPAHLRALTSAAGLVTLTWERRTRYAYRWPSEALAPLGEASEAYEIDLIDGPDQITWNSADKDADVTLSAADSTATVVSAGATSGAVRGMQDRSATNTEGRFFCGQFTGPDSRCVPGIAKSTAAITSYPGEDANGWGWYGQDGRLQNNGGSTAYVAGPAFVSGAIVGVGMKAGALTFYLWSGSEWVSQGTATTGLTGNYFPAWGPGSSASGTRSFALLDMDPPTGFEPWDIGAEAVEATIESTTNTAELSAASLEVTLPVPVAQVALISGVYYGVEVEGNTNINLRRLVAQTEAGASARSPYLGAALIDAVYTASQAYTAAYYFSGAAYGNTFVQRFALSDITTAAATYTASTAGDVVGIAHDGTDLWVLEQFNTRLRKLDGTALTVSTTHALGGAIGTGLAFASGDLFFVDSDDIVSLDSSALTENWRTALPSGYGFTKGVVVAGGNVFVSSGSGVHVYDQAAGTFVLSPGVVAYGGSGYAPSLFVHGADVVCNEGLGGQPLVILDGATGAISQRFSVGRIVDLYGSDGTNVFVSGQSVPTIVGNDRALGYTPIGASLSGYIVRVYQMSATVGRGYPAEVTIP